MTDEAMLELLDSDPSEGIRLLIDRYSSLVYTVAYGKLKGVLSTDDIEDFVSFIFSRIYERRAGIDLSRGTLKGYIVTVARRMCIDEKALTYALLLLGEQDRALLIRRYYYNQTSAQIAEEWKLSDAAVRKRLSRALNKLRELLSEQDSSFFSS